MAIIRFEIEIKEFEVPKVLESLSWALQGKQVNDPALKVESEVVVQAAPLVQQPEPFAPQVVVMPENTYVVPNTVPQQQTPVVPVQSAPPIQQTAPPQAVPTTAPTYTMDQLAVAATQLVDAGRRNELVQLLQEFGAPALTALPKEQYGAFATKLRGMGAKI